MAARLHIAQSPCWERARLGELLTERGLVGTAVEVGSYRGQFAEQLLERWEGRLVCVDPWKAGYDSGDPTSEADMEDALEACLVRLRPYSHRCRILRMTSLDATRRFPPESLDLVYLDGCHQYVSVCSDLVEWWPKLRSGGLLGGHDIVCPWEPEGGWGRFVQPAVFEFSQRVGVTIHLITEPAGAPWSFYLEKP